LKPKMHILLWIIIVLLLVTTILPVVFLVYHGVQYGLFCCIPAILLIGVMAFTVFYSMRNQVRFVAKLNEECERAELATLQQLPIGMCVVDGKGILLHYNNCFQKQILNGANLFGKNLYDTMPFDPERPEQEYLWKNRTYRISSLPYREDGAELTALLWTDITDFSALKAEYLASRPSVLLIMVDNYEDLIQNAKESARLEIGVAIEKLLEDFISQTNGILRRLKNGRFIAIIEERHMEKIMQEKFKILDEAREIRTDEKNYVTFSIGVGHGAPTLQEGEQLAAQSLDMALGRGGDQAAVKTENGYRFFGGVSKGVEKKSRAKTRIIAGAVQDLIVRSENVFIMGHRFGDLDSVGAACGLAGAVRLLNVPVSVVVDPQKNLAPQLISMMMDEIGGDLFLSPQQALEMISDKSLLIIVDTHNKDILESDKLYKAAKNVVVVDHHRKNVNYVDNALVFHHEPYASSACEMVTELIQYFKLDGMVDSCYADCLLSGIMLDTKNFVMRTGVRTFEAAAFLRKIGADTVKVKCLFSGSIEAYRSRTDIVGSAEIVGCHAIAIAPDSTSDVRLVAPQAADELLSISKVDAAFVIYEINHIVNISARSLGAVNVQIIMEALGGGGHQTMAATQIPDISMQDAKAMLLQAISSLQK